MLDHTPVQARQLLEFVYKCYHRHGANVNVVVTRLCLLRERGSLASIAAKVNLARAINQVTHSSGRTLSITFSTS